MKSLSLPTCDTSSAPQSLVLPDVLQRFEEEAVWDTVRTKHYDCRYFTWGEGPPLVFTHGLADDARSFVLPIAALSRHFRCIMYELPTGWGDRANMTGYKHDHLVDDFFTLVDHLELERTYLFGSSFGSTIMLRAMHAQPRRFPRVVLQGAFAHRHLSRSERFMAWLGCRLPWSMYYFPFCEATLKSQYGTAFKKRAAELWKYFVARYTNQPMAALALRGSMLADMDLRPLLPELRQPVLLICGDKDPLVNRACEQALEKGLPNATRAEIRDCGHHPYFTHPEVLAELVYRFLTPLPCNTSACGGP